MSIFGTDCCRKVLKHERDVGKDGRTLMAYLVCKKCGRKFKGLKYRKKGVSSK